MLCFGHLITKLLVMWRQQSFKISIYTVVHIDFDIFNTGSKTTLCTLLFIFANASYTLKVALIGYFVCVIRQIARPSKFEVRRVPAALKFAGSDH